MGPETGKDYKDVIPPTESTDSSAPTSSIFDVVEYNGLENVPETEVPAIIVAKPTAKTTVKKCAGATTIVPMPQTTGPTICPYAMEHVQVTPVTPQVSTVGSSEEAPKLFEVSPNAEEEQIVEITVTD